MSESINALSDLIGAQAPIAPDEYPALVTLPGYIHERTLDAVAGTSLDARERSVHLRYGNNQWRGGIAVRGTSLRLTKSGDHLGAHVNRLHLGSSVFYPPHVHLHTHIVPSEDFIREDLSTLTHAPTPTMLMKQNVEWADGDNEHHTRLSTGFSETILYEADEEWDWYEEQLAKWEDGARRGLEPLYPLPLHSNLVPQYPVGNEGTLVDSTDPDSWRVGGSYVEDILAHASVLHEVGAAFPPMGHIAERVTLGAKDFIPGFTTQTPAQFETNARWLAGAEA